MPQLTDELDRVHYFRMSKCDVELFDLAGFTKLAVNTMELRFLYDKAITDHYIFDYTNYTMGHVVKLTPVYFKKVYTILEVNNFKKNLVCSPQDVVVVVW